MVKLMLACLFLSACTGAIGADTPRAKCTKVLLFGHMWECDSISWGTHGLIQLRGCDVNGAHPWRNFNCQGPVCWETNS